MPFGYICATGTLEKMTRVEFEEAVIAAGGFPQKKVDYSTAYLVVGSKPGKVKVSAAARYGTTQLTEAEFYKWLDNAKAKKDKSLKKLDAKVSKPEPKPEPIAQIDFDLSSRDW